MIPYKDENPSISFPVVTVLLIVLNVVIFLITGLGGTERLGMIAHEWGVVPSSLVHGKAEVVQPVPWLTPLTGMFLHGGLLHLVANLLFLWIFGDNVEDRLGSLRFLLFYFLCGLCADFTHIVLFPNSSVPAIGASGAIAGVMGAYLVLFPGAKVRALLLLFPFIRTVRLPAFFYLIVWFALQILSQVYHWGMEAGVAFGAHIGGFVLGMLLLSLLKVDDKIINGPDPIRAPGHWGW